MPTRLRPAVIAATVLALACAGLIWRSRVVTREWQRALAEARALEARLDAASSERAALWGETTEERAEGHYDRALAVVADWDPGRTWRARQAEDEEARTLRDAFVSEGSEALEALHRGAHARDASWSVDWSLGFEHPVRRLSQARSLSDLCQMKVGLLFAVGRELEAVGVLLDLLQFAGDLSMGPHLIEEMVGLALLTPDVLREGVADGTLLGLSREARARLRTGVAALDDRLGWRANSLEFELAFGARGFEKAFGASGGLHGELRRILTLSQATEYLDTMQRLCAEYEAALEAGPIALIAKVTSGRLESNPISAIVLPQLDSAYRGRIVSLARFRTLAYVLSEGPQPEDVWLAQFLRREVTEAGARLWMDHEVFGDLEVVLP